VSLFSFELDPKQVLGVTTEATLDEIRAAYREKAKRYHPDKGGEDWTFRILSQAYEMLSTARVARHSVRESNTRAPQPQAQAHPGAHEQSHAYTHRPRPERQTESSHAGIFDHEVPRSRIVAVELLCIRYLWDDSDYIWLTQRVPDEERFLSCNLTMSWPDENASTRTLSHDEHEKILGSLQQVFDHMIVATRVVSSRSRALDDQWSGWLAYSNFDRAYKAVGTLHQTLKSREMGMRQWSRDLFIPRTRR
jgi:DnaJ domain